MSLVLQLAGAARADPGQRREGATSSASNRCSRRASSPTPSATRRSSTTTRSPRPCGPPRRRSRSARRRSPTRRPSSSSARRRSRRRASTSRARRSSRRSTASSSRARSTRDRRWRRASTRRRCSRSRKDLRDMQVEVAIDESDISKIRLDQRVTFTVDAFAGTHVRGQGRADPQGRADGAERRHLHGRRRDRRIRICCWCRE